MLVEEVRQEAIATLSFRSAMSGGHSENAMLPILGGSVSALPPGVQALIVCSDLPGRVGGHLLGEALVDTLLDLHAAGHLPSPAATGVVLAGDLFAAPGADQRGASGDVTPVWDAFEAVFRWVVGVLGNHDVLPPRPNVLDGVVVARDGLRIGGVGGIIGKPTKPMRKSEHDFVAALSSVLTADIVVLHEGPGVPERGCRGHASIRARLDHATNKPLVISGHCHWLNPLEILPSGQRVLNVDGRVVVLTSRARTT